MAIASCTDAEFIRLFTELGASGVARTLGVDVKSVYSRRRRIEERNGVILVTPNKKDCTEWSRKYPHRHPITVKSGTVLVGSDAHIWPGVKTTALSAFKYLTKELKPEAIILNGDVVDGAKLSRHPRSGWSKEPTFKEEIEAVSDELHEIRMLAPKAEHVWTLGNHDARFENVLANKAPEIEGARGAALSDQFPGWTHCISTWINGDVVVKHRFKGGIHATHNNTMWAGKTIITGHLHSLKVTPFDDYSGTRWGVDTGMLSQPYGPQFDYGEDNPVNHRSGFIVLTFHKGVMLWPEVCRVIGDGAVDFRGKVISV